MSLVGADRYVPEKLPELEEYVEKHGVPGFNLDVSLGVLRIYQFQPASTQPLLVARILLQAATRLPLPDFKTCLHCVSERVQLEEPVRAAVALGQALECCSFADFWQLAVSNKDLVATVPGFFDAARGYIARSLTLSCHRVSRAVLADCLRLEGDSLDALIQQHSASSSWSVIKGTHGDIIVTKKMDHTPSLTKRTHEAVRFDQVAAVLRSVAL